jgi:uncharacterized protein with FMN-binding domain
MATTVTEGPTVAVAIIRSAPPPTATAAPAPPPTATAAPARSGYRDGTFTALGTSRRGDIQVALTIRGGRITNVAITDASTQYPVSWIAPLQGEVVARQRAQVDLVTGATSSSLAFRGAVQQALAQATA